MLAQLGGGNPALRLVTGCELPATPWSWLDKGEGEPHPPLGLGLGWEGWQLSA